MNKGAETLDVVNNNDEYITTASIDDIYRMRLTHRIVHIFLIHSETKKIYIQKRSHTKTYLPGYYCTSAGGHVRAGETYKQAGERELWEELGIRGRLKHVDDFKFSDNDHTRFVRVFLVRTRKDPKFLDGEVAGGMFSSTSEVARAIRDDQYIHPQLRISFERLIAKNIIAL